MHQDLARPAQRAADDLADIVPRRVGHDRAGFQLGHVEQIGDESIQPLGLVDHGGEQIVLLGIAQVGAEVAQRRGRAEHRGQRRLEVVRDRGQERAAQPVGFHRALDAVHVLDQQHALDRERALVDQRIEQPALVRRQQGPGAVVVDADHPDRAAAGAHRQEQPFSPRQRVGAAAGRAIVAPGPVGGGEIGLIELILRRIAALDGQHSVLRQQQHHAHLEHQRDLVGGRPQHVVQRRGAGELAAEGIERFGGADAADRGVGLGAHPRRDVGDQKRDQHEEEERRDIGRVGDGEGIDRRQEEEIVAQRGRDARQQRRPEAVARRGADHGGQEDEVDILDAEERLDQLGRAEPERRQQQRHQIGPRIERLLPLRGLHRRLADRQLVAGDHVDADIAGAPHQIVHHGSMRQLEPARARRLADDDLGDVVGLGEIDDVVGDAAADAGKRQRLAAERFREPHGVGQPVALLVAQLQAAPRLDADRGPLRMQPVGEALGVAHEAGRARILAQAHQDALAGGPGPLDRIGLHVVEQLLVDPLGGAAQRQLAQRGQIARREIVFQRPFGLLGHIDLALLEPLDQIVGRQVDQLDRIGAIDHRVGHRLAHPHMGDLRDDVVEALDVLDVDRGVDVDAVRQQLLDVEIALRMPAARRIGMGELVDQRELRPSRDQCIEVHLFERLVAISQPLARYHFEALEQGLRLRPSVGFDDADHDVDARLEAGVGAREHLVGLADAGGGADEDLQPARSIGLPARRLQQRIRRGSFVRVALIGHTAI